MKNSLFTQFLRKPFMTGAICPSSLELAKMLVSGVGIETAGNIAELGPGTGAVTATILQTMPENGKFFAVELNSDVLAELQNRFPQLRVYNDSAAHLGKLIQQENMKSLDLVVSGLPWAIFPPSLQDEILQAIYDSLAPGGYFTTFAYLQGVLMPNGMSFRKRLSRMFSVVEKSPIVWRNVPPAFVYRCRK